MTNRLQAEPVRQAGEHLSELERVLQRPGDPDPRELLRLARAVRLSAEQAAEGTIAAVALRLEDAAAAYSSGDLAWTGVIASMASETVGELRNLVVALSMAETEEERLLETNERWGELLNPGEDGVVPVGVLLLRGDAALRQALALRPRLEAALDRSGREDPEVREVVAELFDLVQLGLSREAERG